MDAARSCTGVSCSASRARALVVADAVFPALDAETWGARVAEAALWDAGVLALATSYVCAIVLLFRRPDWNRTLSFLAPVGRMALTNYLGQSVACILIFYGIGLGWYGRVGPTAVLGICCRRVRGAGCGECVVAAQIPVRAGGMGLAFARLRTAAAVSSPSGRHERLTSWPSKPWSC